MVPILVLLLFDFVVVVVFVVVVLTLIFGLRLFLCFVQNFLKHVLAILVEVCTSHSSRSTY